MCGIFCVGALSLAPSAEMGSCISFVALSWHVFCLHMLEVLSPPENIIRPRLCRVAELIASRKNGQSLKSMVRTVTCAPGG
eukprot:2385914-Amphidinium_carterae.1